MEHVVLVIHLILALAIIILVLIQRSEGGGLGIGGSGGGLGGMATAGQTANALTRLTGICAGLFFITSLTLGVLAGTHHKSKSLLETLDNPAVTVDTPAETTDKELPEAKGAGNTSKTPSAPISE